MFARSRFQVETFLLEYFTQFKSFKRLSSTPMLETSKVAEKKKNISQLTK